MTKAVPSSTNPNGPAGARLRDYLTGFLRAGPDNRAMATNPAIDWRTLASEELRRRQARFLGVLDDEILAALASGAIDLATVASQVDGSVK